MNAKKTNFSDTHTPTGKVGAGEHGHKTGNLGFIHIPLTVQLLQEKKRTLKIKENKYFVLKWYYSLVSGP